MLCTFVGCEKPRGYRNSSNCEEHRALRELCKAEDCGRLPRKGIEHCDKHMHLRPVAIYYKICSFEECGRRADAKGHCAPHRQQFLKGQELRPLKQRHVDPFCAFDGCDRPNHVKGLCNAHEYQRQKGRALKPLNPNMKRQKRNLKQRDCSFEECRRPARSATGKGHLCSGHLDQQRRGAVLHPINATRSKGGHVNVGGYRLIHVNGRNTPEHRAVMEQLIGRPLLRRETVHHINGHKLDNRPENLELWVSAHQKGQRVQDLVDFVVNTYPELVEDRLRKPLLFVA